MNAGVGNVAVYKIDDKLCRNSELDRRSVLSVPKTVQLKQNRDEILHIFIAHGEQHAIPSQLIVNLVHNLKRLEASLFAQVDVSMAPLLLQAKDIGGISTRVCEGAGRSRRPYAADKAARAQARPIGRTRALASARRIWGLKASDLLPGGFARCMRSLRIGNKIAVPKGRLSASCGFLPFSPLARRTRMCICTSSCRLYYPRDSQLAQRLQVNQTINQTMGKHGLRLFRGSRRWRAARLDHLRHQDALSKGRILRMKQSRRSCVCNFASKTLQWCRSVLRREVMQ